MLGGPTPTLSCARATRAGLTVARWPPRLTRASEGPRCGQRAAMQLTFSVPGNGPCVGSSEELGRGAVQELLDAFIRKRIIAKGCAISQYLCIHLLNSTFRCVDISQIS